jgi:recombination protein RecA
MPGSPAALRKQLEAAIGGPLVLAARQAPELLPTGVREVDSLDGGLPRGGLTEICGPASSGRTSLLLSILAQAGEAGETCALIDAAGAFDPLSAAAAGVHLDRLLWVRCGGDAETALKAVDLVVQGGGFGLVAMDLGDAPPETARRIPMTSWFRLRRAVEHTRTVLVAVEREPHAKTCASLVLELRREQAVWTGAPGCSQILRGMRVQVERRKPAGSMRASFAPRAAG